MLPFEKNLFKLRKELFVFQLFSKFCAGSSESTGRKSGSCISYSERNLIQNWHKELLCGLELLSLWSGDRSVEFECCEAASLMVDGYALIEQFWSSFVSL